MKLVRQENMTDSKSLLLAWAEYGLRPADEVDYLIRRRLVPVLFEPPTPSRKASMQNNGSLSDVQAAIGQCLRAEYDLVQSVPARLVDLLQQLDR